MWRRPATIRVTSFHVTGTFSGTGDFDPGAELYLPVGNLAFSTLDDQPHLDDLETVSRHIGADIEVLDQAALRARFPQFRLAKRALLERDESRRVEFDRAFHFQRSHLVEVPLGLTATTLAEFRAGLASVDASAIYLHIVETRALPATLGELL